MTSIISIQNSLAAGEISPALWGRTDLDKWNKGTSTCRNFIADYRGGVFSRPGLAYIGTSKQGSLSYPPRLIPFVFNINQSYTLEFGDHYMRIIYRGGFILETPKTITGISTANPAILQIPSHGFNGGDWINITGVGGLTQFNGLSWIISNVLDSNHIEVVDLFGRAVNTTTWGLFASNGQAARIYTVTSPYAVADLPYLKYTQSADVMTLTCVNTATGTEYPPYNLTRSGNTSWAFTTETFASTIAAPTNLTAVAFSSSQVSTWYSYVVTAVDSKTGEESNPSTATEIQNNDLSIYQGSNNLSWSAVSNASSYNIYATTPSYGYQISAGNLYGFIGASEGTNFVDTNIVPDFTVVPPQHADPFSPGAIVQIIPGGSQNGAYSQETVGYALTGVGSGSGFSGQPVVTNGDITGFVVQNSGSGYPAVGVGINFTDSGGGIAMGNFTFSANMSVSQNIVFNGVTLLAQGENDASLGPYEFNIGSALQFTLQSICTWLNSSLNPNIVPAVYTCDDTHIYVAYKTPGADGNNYTLSAGSSGATASGTTLTGGGTIGSGATGVVTVGPQTGVNPSVVSYFQQRRVYANTLNQPDTYFMSQPGLFENMDTSIPTTDADAISGTPWSQQVNGIQWLVPMPGGLVALTGKGAWQINGGSQAAITPANQVATPQAYNGCNALVPPLTINYDILYVQEKGTIVRDLAYNFFVNIYTGTDLTLFSNHLFTGSYNQPYQIVQWAWAEEPFKLVWAVRNDGQMLCLTYLKEIGASWSGEGNSVFAWTRHDTNGLFQSVSSITEPPVDATYVVVKRFVLGSWYYYIERFDNRFWQNVEESFCVDAGLGTGGVFPSANLYPGPVTVGTAVTCIADASVFSPSDVGQILRVDGGKGTITTYNSPTSIVVDFSQQPITNLIPNDPSNTPVPAAPGNWSIAPLVTSVSGLNHLEGLSVAVLADGSVVPNQTVVNTNGFVGFTLPEPASIVVSGLPYTCQAQTLYMDKPGQATAQTKRKTITAVGVRTEFTRGLQIGADQPDSSTQQNYAPVVWTNMNEIKERNNSVLAGTAVPLLTGDSYKTVTAGWTTKGQIAVQQVYPLPAKVLALISYWCEADDR